MSVTYTNPKGQSRTETVNAVGQKTQTTDHLGGNVWYGYDAFLNLVYMKDQAGNETKIAYNIRGHKTKMQDPDQGTWEYTYYADGSLKTQKDAKGQITTSTYDVLNRLKTRRDHDGKTATWVYDTCSKGKLCSVSDGTYTESFAYDSLGRPTLNTSTIDGVSYSFTHRYDSLSRVSEVVYPNNFTVTNQYHGSLGFLQQVNNKATSAKLWEAKAFNSTGQLDAFQLGGVLNLTHFYSPQSGLLNSIDARVGVSPLASLQYTWDGIGNLTRRHDDVSKVTDTFTFDALSRLTNTATLYNGVTTNVAVAYDSLGNITSKSDVGAYLYKQACNGITAGPHAASTVACKAYCYDANGSQISGDGRTITYTPFNKPSRIVKAGNTTDFFYGPERDYYKKVESGTQGASTTVIVGAYEKETKGTMVTHRVQVGDSILIETKNNVQSTLFLIKDHLGSLVTVIDSLGTIKERLSYDPWGKRRAPTGTSINLLTLQTLYTDRGYTGHLHADGVGLVHMNGRMYDPILARFISADPLIQSPNNLQSLNRYSYVMNNPLSYTDPTGYSWSKFRDKWLKPIAAIAITIYMPGMLATQFAGGASACAMASAGQIAAANMITGAVVGYIQTGTLQGAAIGAWTAGAFNAAGASSGLTNTLAHGMIGGISSAANGGSFKNGFISAGISAGAANSGFTEGLSSALGGGKAGNAIVAALVGGVASKATGGQFGYGAVLAAMGQAMNHDAHPDSDWVNEARDFAAGLADGMSGGGTYILREFLGTNGVIDVTSPAYLSGLAAGAGLALATDSNPTVVVGPAVVARGAAQATKVTIQFGKNANQVSHAFRHTDALGLDRAVVQSSVHNHLAKVATQMPLGKPFNQVIDVGGQRIQYTAFKLQDGVINVGRIHGAP